MTVHECMQVMAKYNALFQHLLRLKRVNLGWTQPGRRCGARRALSHCRAGSRYGTCACTWRTYCSTCRSTCRSAHLAASFLASTASHEFPTSHRQLQTVACVLSAGNLDQFIASEALMAGVSAEE